MPVWPICFCSIWPIGAAPPMRLPAARMPMARMVMPPSDNAPITASDARSTVSFSGCLPNFVMWIPRIQMSSAMSGSFRRCETESDRLGADDVAAHARPVAVDDRRDERHGDARRRERHDRERPDLARGGDVGGAELGAEAARTGVAPVEEPGTAARALVGHEVGLGLEHEVVDQRDLGHP